MKWLKRFESLNSLEKKDILPELLELGDIGFLDNLSVYDNSDTLVINIGKRLNEPILCKKIDGVIQKIAPNYTNKNIGNVLFKDVETKKPKIYANTISDKEEQLIYAVDEDSYRLLNTFDFDSCIYSISISESGILNPETFNTDRMININIEIKLYK